MRRTFLIAVLLALAAPATAAAGGWTTVGLEAMPGADVRAGGTWTAELTILQHGRTPLDGQTPVLTITSGTRMKTFHAFPAGRPGAYRADVVFPQAGSWRLSIDHDWGTQHQFGPFAIDAGTAGAGMAAREAAPAPGPGRGDGGDSWIAVLAAVLVGLAAAGAAAIAMRRRREPVPAP